MNRASGLVWILFVAMLGVGVRPAFAGQSVALTCTASGCGYTGTADLGGGFMFEMKTGYCVRCSRFTSVTWKRKEPAIKPIATVWAPMTGREESIYPCPKCAQPFLAISSAAQFKFCPKCQRPTIKSKLLRMYD